MNDSKAKILVVDDDPILLELLVETLTTIGYDTGKAVDGLDALAVLSKEKFDLMVSDIKMPNLDGIGLLQEVRKLYPNLPVLFITGVNAPEIIGKATPDGFLSKPFRINHIEEMIEKTLQSTDQPKPKIKNIHTSLPVIHAMIPKTISAIANIIHLPFLPLMIFMRLKPKINSATGTIHWL